jgi:hypothetical protein
MVFILMSNLMILVLWNVSVPVERVYCFVGNEGHECFAFWRIFQIEQIHQDQADQLAQPPASRKFSPLLGEFRWHSPLNDHDGHEGDHAFVCIVDMVFPGDFDDVMTFLNAL